MENNFTSRLIRRCLEFKKYISLQRFIGSSRSISSYLGQRTCSLSKAVVVETFVKTSEELIVN